MKPDVQKALQVLDSEPDNADALAALAAAAEGGGNGKSDPAAARALDESRRLHRERGDFELVVRLLDLELGWEKDAARRAALLVEKGRVLLDELLAEREAEACFQRALEEKPGDEEAEEALSQIALIRDNWKKIVAKYLDEARASTDRQLTSGLYVSAAELCWKREPDGSEVEEHLRRALEVDPRNRKAAGHLERRLRQKERWSELGELLEQRADLAGAPKDERTAHLLALAELQRDRLKRADHAVDTMRKVLAVDAGNARALKAVVDALSEAGDWAGVVKVYESALKARARDAEASQQYLVQLGMLYWKKLGNAESAEAQFAKVRKADPANPLALDFYRGFHKERGEGTKLLQVLQQAQKAEQDPKKRLALGVEMAAIAEAAAGNNDKAIDIWKGILRSDPQSTEAVSALKRLYVGAQKWNALLELLKEQIDQVALPAEPGPERDAAVEKRIALLLEVVAIYRDRLGLDVMVINTFNSILALSPRHEGALAALAAKYEAMGRWNDLIGALQKTADATADEEHKVELLRRIASLWVEKFGNHNQAVKPLEELYALAPGDPDAVARLRDIYAKRRAWRQLLDLEQKELARADQAGPPAPRMRRAKLVEMAKLAAERLGDPREAMALWNQVLEQDPDDAEALAALGSLYEREKRWPALVEVLRRQRKALAEPKQAIPLLEKIGNLCSEKLAAPALAVDAYQEILKLQPNQPKAMRTLRELFVQLGQFERLEAIYAEHGAWDELCEALLTVAERSPDAQLKLKLNLRVAELALEKLRQPERAAKAYERILASEPADSAASLQAAQALVPIYRQGEKWPRLLATYEALLAHAKSVDEQLALHREIYALCERQLGSKQLAFSWVAKAYALRPPSEVDDELERELVRLAAEAEAWDELAVIQAEQVEATPEGERKVARLRALAELIFTRLGRADEARRYYEQVLARVPGDPAALDALERIHAQAGDHVALLDVYRRRIAMSAMSAMSGTEGAARVELLYKIAWIEEEQAGDLGAAAATYHQILEEEPHAARALRALERIHQARGNHQGLADVVARQLDAVEGDPEAEAALAFRLGEIQELQLGQREAALASYERAFARDPSHKGTIAALERFLVEGSASRVYVARLLAPVYEKHEETEKQVGALRIVLEATRDPNEELELLRTLGALSGRRLGDAEAAYGYAARIFERLPGDADARRELAELADLLDAHEDQAKRLAAAEERTSDPALATELAWELGVLLEERLHRDADAEQAYRRVLGRDAHHAGALEALERIYRGAERFAELRDLLVRRTELADADADRVALLFQISDLDEGVLDDAESAARVYRQVLEVEPGSARAFKALERLLGARSAFRELDELYAHAVDNVADAGERADLKARRALLHLDRLDEPRDAADLFEEALAEDPRCEAVHRGLERLLGNPELRQRVARGLEPLYVDAEDWPRLLVVLRAQRETAEGPEAAELLRRIAALAEERLGDPAQAFDAYREALRLDPADEGVRAQLERLAVALDRHRELAEALEEAEGLAEAHDLSLRRALLERSARLWEERLVDAGRARSAWRRLYDLDPSHLETARPAAEALARIYQAEEAWPELIEVLRQQAHWAEVEAPAGDGPEGARDRKHYLRQIALIQEDVTQDFVGAVATHREILDGDPADERSLDALERLHAAQDQWPELIDVLRRRVEVAGESSRRRDLLWRIAEITERRLTPEEGPFDDAIAAHAAVLDESAEDLPALEALARLYQAADRPADLLDVLERRLALASDIGERVALRGRLAELLEGPLARRDQALERYRETLVEDPGNAAAVAGLERMLDDEELRLAAAEVLEPIYEGAEEGDKLVHLHELWAEHAPDPRERVSRLQRIAALRERDGDRKGAFEALARAARIAVSEPELPSLLAEIERVAMAGAGTELLGDQVALYRELGPDILDAEVQGDVYLAVAAKSRATGDRATARDYYRRVLDGSPEHAGALDALEALYLDGKEHEPLLEIYNRRAELFADDPDRRRHYLFAAARLCREELHRETEAVACYEQILEMLPADAGAATQLEQLYKESARFADLADLLERRLGFADDLDEAVALRVRLGEIYERELSDPSRAVENFRAALGGDPSHAGAIAALERFLDDADHRVEATEVLEPVYAARHDWKALIRIYEIRLAATDEPVRRLQLTRRIARLHEEQLEDLDGAFTWYGRVFREDPADRAIRDQLARLANILGAHARMAEVFEEYLKETYEETPASIEVLRTLAAIYDGRLADPEKAKACYLRLLAHDPQDSQAFQLLETSLTRAEKWHDLLAVYREAADNALEPDRRKALLFKVCTLLRDKLGDRDAAIDAYRAVLDLDEDDALAGRALETLYQEGERWHDLAELLGRRLDKASDGERAQLKLRLGRLYQEKLGDVASAIDAYEEVIGVDPENREALGALENLILDESVRFRIAEILEPIYRAHDEWQKLVVIYDAELEFIDDKVRRVELLREIARLHLERGRNARLAFAALARAWAEEATEGEDREAPLYEELSSLAAELAAWTELLGVLQQAVADAGWDHDLAARLWARIADLQDQRLHDVAAATESWRKVVAVRDEDPVAWAALERLLSAQDRPAELVPVLEKRAALSQDVREHKTLAYRVADLYERVLGKPEKAIATWREVLTLDEGDAPALAALARLHRERGEHRELAQVYARQIDLAGSEAERRPIRFALAETCEALGDVFEAIVAYKGALDANAEDRQAIDALLRLYERESMWVELLEMLDAAAALSSGEARQALLLRAARVVEERQGEPLEAVERYRQLLDEAPMHAGARAALEALLDGDRDEVRAAAASVLEPLYQAYGEHRPLARVLEVKLAGTEEPAERRALLASIAELHEVGREDESAAFATWGRLLLEDPTDGEVRAQLERLAAQRGSWAELAALYRSGLDAVLDPEAQRQLVLAVAALHEERLGDRDQAIDYYRKALDVGGDEREPLRALDRLLSADPARARDPGGSRTLELAEVLEREAAAVEDAVAQAALWFRLGELRRIDLADADGALAAYRETLDRDPSHPGARAALEGLLSSGAHAHAVLDLLEPLYAADGNHRKRLALAEARLVLTDGPVERAALLQRMAAIAENDLGDAAAALDAAGRALAESPEDGALADEVERLGGASGRLDEAARALEKVLERELPTEVARELGLRAGRLFDQLGDDARAEARYAAVLAVDGENADALVALERIYRAQQRPAQLGDVLERRAAVELDPSNRKALLAEVALLREGPLADLEGAVAAWKRVLEIDDADAQALGALATLHEAAGRFRELIEVLDAQARFAPDPHEQAALKARVARLHDERLGDPARAVEAWREVLDALPDSQEALHALESLHARAGDWLAVQEVLVRQLDLVGSPAEQVGIYFRLAELAADRQHDPDGAIGYYQRVLDIVPGHERAMEELERTLEQQQKWYDLVDALKAHAELAATDGDREREVALLVRAADVLEEKLESAESATEILERVLARDPRNARALGSLAKIYEAAGDLDRCAETLERAAALVENAGRKGGADAAELYFRLGRVEDRRSGEGAGEPHYGRALQLDPTHPGALDALERIARERQEFPRLAQLLALRAERAEPASQRALYLELARLHTEKLGRPGEALPYLERARAAAPSDPQVIELLADAYYAAGQLNQALPLYLGLIEQTLQANKGRRTKELARLHFRVAGIAEKVGDGAKALDQYQAAYQIDAGHLPTLAALGRLYMTASDWEKARRMYRSLLLQNLDPASGVRKADVYLALGEIHERVNEAPKAVGMYERGLELEPANERLRQALARARAAR